MRKLISRCVAVALAACLAIDPAFAGSLTPVALHQNRAPHSLSCFATEALSARSGLFTRPALDKQNAAWIDRILEISLRARYYAKFVFLNGGGLGFLIGGGGGGVYDPNALPKAPSVPIFSEALRKRVEDAKRVFSLAASDAAYLLGMAAQREKPDDPNTQLIIHTPETPDGNFRLAADLTETERRNLLGEVDYADVVKDPRNVEEARKIEFTFNLLHGGIGENVGRAEWLAKRLGKNISEIQLGAKGTDLGYFVEYKGTTVFISEAELQLLRSLEKMNTRPRPVARLIYQPIVNSESRKSFEDLFDSIYLDDRVSPPAHPRSYRDVMKQMGVDILSGDNQLLMQNALPGIEVQSEYVGEGAERRRSTEGQISLDPQGYQQPGGHGQMGLYFMLRAQHAARVRNGEPVRFRVFGNGDNANADLHEALAPYMRREGVLVMQLNTHATPADRKGGKTGVRQAANGKWAPDMIELAQARAADRKLDRKDKFQEHVFYEAGQAEGVSQPFNTNGYVMDENRLEEVLQDLYDTIGESEFLVIINPTLIHKPAKKKNGKLYVPIDGTIGSVMHNINAWFSTDPRGAQILKRHGAVRFLAYTNVPRESFAPVKSVWDIFVQDHSDYSVIDMHSFKVRDQVSGLIPPDVEIESVGPDGKDSGYWSELQRMVDAFGFLRVRGLKSLYINGPVRMHNAELRGHVRIVNQSGQEQDLRSDRYREMLGGAGLLKEGNLILEDVRIEIDSKGELSILKSGPSVGAEAVWLKLLPSWMSKLSPAFLFSGFAIVEGLRAALLAQATHGHIVAMISLAVAAAIVHLFGVFIQDSSGQWRVVGIQNLKSGDRATRAAFWNGYFKANAIAATSLLAFPLAQAGVGFAIMLMAAIVPHLLINLISAWRSHTAAIPAAIKTAA